ncbi:MAG: hypothetical protein H5T68_04190 [Chloroflexi bacterium]|nr:hypothetical protein [Chloroflexota bacterium]
MERLSTKQSRSTISAEDEIGELIRWSLEETVGEAEPPADVWHKIIARIKEMDAPAFSPRRRRRVALPLASFVQAVVISVLLLAFGLEVNRNMPLSQKAYQASATPTISKVSAPAESDQDMLRGYMLLQKEKEPLPRNHRGERIVEIQKFR